MQKYQYALQKLRNNTDVTIRIDDVIKWTIWELFLIAINTYYAIIYHCH